MMMNSPDTSTDSPSPIMTLPWRLVAEASNEATFSLDESWRFTYVNQYAEALWGRSREVLLGKTMWELFPTLVGSSLELFYRQAMADRKTNTLEIFSDAMQAWYVVRVYPVLDQFIVSFRDITERKQLEHDLHTSEARLKALSEAAFEGVIIHDAGVVIDANDAAVQILGYGSLDNLIGQPISRLIAVTWWDTVAQHIADNFEGAYEMVGVRQDGTHFPAELRAKTSRFGGRNLRVVAFRDLTERKRLESQLLQSQKMESLGQLAGGIAHDFNNLLTGILGYCDIILSDLSQTDSIYTDIEEIKKAGNRAAHLVRQILAFSRQQVLQPRLVNLNETVQGMETLLNRVIGANIALLSMLDPQLESVMVDVGQIEQVILNLAVNARDAMPDGGELLIETANVELDEEYRSSRHPEVKTGRYVMLAVSDTGIGMDQATQEKIFEPFFTTKGVGKGTGLGLATVYGIVRQSGGAIWVYSEPDIGTTFKIYFPVVENPLRESSTSGTDDQHHNASFSSASRPVRYEQTILIVEDEPSIRELIGRVLSQAGYTTLLAQHGQEALQLAASYSGQIDIVVTDMVMPQMGGYALVERLKQQWAHAKIVYISGYPERAVLRDNRVYVGDAFIQKPFTPEQLLRQIDEVAKKKKQ